MNAKVIYGAALPFAEQRRKTWGRVVRPWGWYVTELKRDPKAGRQRRRGRARKVLRTQAVIASPLVDGETFTGRAWSWAVREAHEPGRGSSDFVMVRVALGALIGVLTGAVTAIWMPALWGAVSVTAFGIMGALAGFGLATRALQVEIPRMRREVFEEAEGLLVVELGPAEDVAARILQLDRAAGEFLAGRVSAEDFRELRQECWSWLNARVDGVESETLASSAGDEELKHESMTEGD